MKASDSDSASVSASVSIKATTTSLAPTASQEVVAEEGVMSGAPADMSTDVKPKAEMLQTQKIKKCALKNKNENFTNILPKSMKNIKTKIKRASNTAPTTTLVTAKPFTRNTRNKIEQSVKTEYELQQQQQLYATTKEKFLLTLDLLAVVRRNASDKLKLIQMVHDNPILWDSRLPNFKGAEEEKNRAWELIGKHFNAPGRRVARAFKSLRESYRRELAHVKLMGNGFKPKWSLYEAMDFLRDVIRERKGGSHAVEQATIGLNLSAFSQHINNNNHNINNNNNNNNNNKATMKLNALHSSLNSSFNDSALNLSKCSALNMSHEDYYYLVKPELDLSGRNSVTQQPIPAHQNSHTQQQQLQQQQQHLQLLQNVHTAPNDSRVSSTRNDTTQNTTFDDMDASSMRSTDDASVRNTAPSHEGSDEVEELDAIDADFPYPLILDSNSPNSAGASVVKRRRKDMNGTDDVDEDDEYEGQMLQQHRHLRQQSGGLLGMGMGGMLGMDMPPPQTVREVLNSKFCGFISAKLNSMEDIEADNLMNKILMLLVQQQNNETKKED